MTHYRHIDLHSIDPKEVARVNLELTEARLKTETNHELRAFLRKRVRALKAAATFPMFQYLQENPLNLN